MMELVMSDLEAMELVVLVWEVMELVMSDLVKVMDLVMSDLKAMELVVLELVVSDWETWICYFLPAVLFKYPK